MKRIYACILIVAALLAVSLYSSGRVQGFAQDISADLDCALEAVESARKKGYIFQCNPLFSIGVPKGI